VIASLVGGLGVLGGLGGFCFPIVFGFSNSPESAGWMHVIQRMMRDWAGEFMGRVETLVS
jgi:nitrate/nitrite transporter NarK